MPSFISHSSDLPAGTLFGWPSEGIAFGGDYNPEQWPEEVWQQDVELMRRAGVTTVTVGVFSWGLIEVADGVYEWDRMDRVLDLLHANGIGVDLATPTAAPPVWLLQAHPDIAPVTESGVRHAQGGRLAWHPSSTVFRRYALRIVRALAERYGTHPAVRMWHVGNELGNENARSYDQETAAAWRVWLEERYGDIDTLNAAWGTEFWGHRLGSFAEIEPPRFSSTSHNPGLALDFARFGSDALLAHYEAERAVLREVTPHLPVTTNFMVMNNPGADDYARWAEEVDIVANDHYTIGSDPLRHRELSFSADRVRGMAAGRPWLLMEHSTSAVNWQSVNRAKSPGEMTRNSLAHVARGADGVLFFQWRASTAGAEQFHSGMVPHAGPETRQFREVVELGATLRALAPVQGSIVPRARVAILFDTEAAWAYAAARTPSDLVRIIDLPRAVHDVLTTHHIAVDVIRPCADLTGYDMVVVPTLYLARDADAAALAAHVASGAHVIVSYLSGIVDEHNRVRPGGYPGAYRELLGVRAEEFVPLFADETLALDDGSTASLWAERLEVTDAEVLVRYADGDLAGLPAVTRRTVGAGTASYLSARVDGDALARLVLDVVERAGIAPIARADAGLEITRRVGADAAYLFAINHDGADRAVATSGVDLVTGRSVTGRLVVPAGGVAVVREETDA
jgi:beta-galactosidase